MLFLISPAKALDTDTPPCTATHTQPLFVPQATELIGVLRQKSPQEIASLMGLSDALARFEEDEMVGIVRFTTDDCVRSTLCQRALKAYY